jgi:hypothetical protein
MQPLITAAKFFTQPINDPEKNTVDAVFQQFTKYKSKIKTENYENQKYFYRNFYAGHSKFFGQRTWT